MKKNYFKSLMQAAVLLCAPLIISSCDELATEDNPISSYISMNTDAVTLTLKAGTEVTYTRTAIAASTAVIEYSSEDEKVATVDASTGKVTAVGGGETNIVAKATGYNTSGKKIYVTEEVKYKLIVVDPESSFAYDEDFAPTLIYASAAVNFAPVAPQTSKGVKTFTYTVAYKATADAAYGGETALPGEGKFSADAAGYYRVTATSATYEDYITSHSNTTASYVVKVDQAYAYARWDATEKKLKNDTIYAKDFKKTISAGIDAAEDWEAGTYYVSTDVTISAKITIKGDVNLIVADGKTLTLTSTFEDGTENTHKLNIFREVGENAVTITGSTENADKFVNLKEINFHGANFNVTLDTKRTGTASPGYSFKGIGAVNIYGSTVKCTTSDNPGETLVKMRTDGIITLYKGSFNTERCYFENHSKLASPTGYTFQESSDGTTGWAAISEGEPSKQYVKSIAPAE